ncbi:ImmA/IrrE family metallo-endopeptidase [Sinomonas sp. P10A9]|uniref:ImmA/IrrE family metallo-endopeptidase n=1 Tax=Sinomonas puerhi TaxID=3238584 RepID=A0AB39L071_9MICC
MTIQAASNSTERSVLASLRALIPHRTVTSQSEALRVAEHQATRLLELHRIDDGPIPTELIPGLPKIEIELVDAPISGASFWNGNAWIIELNKHENYRRQRFTLAHEYKHIVDHNRADTLYLGTRDATPQQQAEQAADYFAGCLLVPKKLLKRAYYSGIQRTRDLADLFQVSEAAMAVRLRQTGIIEPASRCTPASTPFSRTWQYRFNRTARPQGV